MIKLKITKNLLLQLLKEGKIKQKVKDCNNFEEVVQEIQESLKNEFLINLDDYIVNAFSNLEWKQNIEQKRMGQISNN